MQTILDSAPTIPSMEAAKDLIVDALKAAGFEEPDTLQIPLKSCEVLKKGLVELIFFKGLTNYEVSVALPMAIREDQDFRHFESGRYICMMSKIKIIINKETDQKATLEKILQLVQKAEGLAFFNQDKAFNANWPSPKKTQTTESNPDTHTIRQSAIIGMQIGVLVGLALGWENLKILTDNLDDETLRMIIETMASGEINASSIKEKFFFRIFLGSSLGLTGIITGTVVGAIKKTLKK